VRFVIFVEGSTERLSLSHFLKRWLDPRLKTPVGIKPVKFRGVADYYGGIARRAALDLNSPDVAAGIGLLDLYGPAFYPDRPMSLEEKYSWGKDHLEKKVSHPKFHQYFAVHETEAWLFSDPQILPPKVGSALPPKCSRPETVNFDEPPARLLAKLYRQKLDRAYQKTTDGAFLFQKLSPERAYEKCPYLKAMLDDMLALAQNALR
jgi:hypothetical protein